MTTADELRLASRRFTLFSFLLAAAIVFHQSKIGDWEVFSAQALVTLAALWTMLRPSSTTRLFVLMGAHLTSTAIDLPYVVNHWLLLAFAEVGILVALGVGSLRGATWARDRGAMYLALAPYLRIQVLLVYLFAALAKVNSDFLDSDLSCGVAMVDELVERSPVELRNAVVDQSAIWGTIAIELALPIMLSLRATRVPAIFLGGAFHVVLALSGHLPFSGFALAFYALFVPDDLPDRWDQLRAARPRLDQAAGRLAELARRPWAFPAAAGVFLTLAALSTYGPGQRVQDAAYLTALLAYLALVALLGTLLFLCVRSGAPARWGAGFLRLAHPAWLLGPALVFLNAFTPYVGLKTQDAWTMYSNLQTEPGHWNHLLVPEDVRVFKMQDHLVRIISSDEKMLAQAARKNRLWVWWALRQRAHENPDFSVTYERDGRRYIARRAGDDPRLADRPNRVLAWAWMFRDVPQGDDNTCRVKRSTGANQGS